MKILSYYPASQSAVWVESFMEGMLAQGHEVYLLTQSEWGPLHDRAKALGVHAFAYPVKKRFSTVFYLEHIWYLIRFCWQHRIDFIHSEIQQANIVAVFAGLFVRGKLIVHRHHGDYAMYYRYRMMSFFDRVINRLAPTIIVAAKSTARHMVKAEGCRPEKIQLAAMPYNWSHYPQPDQAEVAALRDKYGAKLLLVAIGRFIPLKRFLETCEVIDRLVAQGKDMRLLLIGRGPEHARLRTYIDEKKLQDRIVIVDQYVPNIFSYFAAGDVLVHLSRSESSCNVTKEAALAGLPSIVCRDVGDFDEYIVDGVNGFLIDKENGAAELEALLAQLYEDKSALPRLGRQIQTVVNDTFSLEKTIHRFDSFHYPDKHTEPTVRWEQNNV